MSTHSWFEKKYGAKLNLTKKKLRADETLFNNMDVIFYTKPLLISWTFVTQTEFGSIIIFCFKNLKLVYLFDFYSVNDGWLSVYPP